MRHPVFGFLAIAACSAALLASFDAAAAKKAAPPPEPVEDLTNLELDQLMSMEVTGVTRRASAYGKSPAAIFVLTGEDIRRSGARTIAEALRMVPGLQVNRTSASGYTVTSRGFGGDKLQVLLDGRSVYTPLTSTVFWNLLDTYFEDIARIEVIRGPGATVWGANAVNGVINIITVPAADSAGTHVFVGGGDEFKAFGGFRSGGRIGDGGKGRAYVKSRETDSTDRANGTENTDGQRMTQAGARIDTDLGSLGALTVSGDVYDSREYTASFPAGTTTDQESDGRNLGVQWSRGWSGGASTQASLYYDGYDLRFPTIFTESRDTFDLNLQHNFSAIGDHLVTTGLGARVSSDETGGAPQNIVVFDPQHRTTETYSAFVQDEWALAESLWLIAGTKVERNDFTGWEVSPGARLGWQMTDTFFTWTSVARATRTPNRIDSDVAVFCTGTDTPVTGCPGAGSTLGIGNPELESEKLIAYEWGLRSQFIPSLLADVALFYNTYTDLRSSETSQRFANGIEAEGMGGELSLSWQPLEWMSVQGFYKYLKVDARKDQGSADTTSVNTLENGTAQQAAGLRVGVQPITVLTVDSFLRYVDALPAQNVPDYTELNLRAAWAVTPFLELSVAGRNLLDKQHPEAGASPVTRSENPRNVFAELGWRWQ